MLAKEGRRRRGLLTPTEAPPCQPSPSPAASSDVQPDPRAAAYGPLPDSLSGETAPRPALPRADLQWGAVEWPVVTIRSGSKLPRPFSIQNLTHWRLDFL